MFLYTFLAFWLIQDRAEAHAEVLILLESFFIQPQTLQ